MPALVNPKHEFYAHELARGLSQIEAYQLAGYKPDAANASTLANRPDVSARVQELTATFVEHIGRGHKVTAERIVAELANIGFSNITDVVQVIKGKLKIADTAAIPESVKSAIAEISKGRDGIKVKFHDKPRALEQLGRHLGLFKENIDLNVNVSLADLVNGSYKLEAGEVKPDDGKTIEHEPTPAKDAE